MVPAISMRGRQSHASSKAEAPQACLAGAKTFLCLKTGAELHRSAPSTKPHGLLSHGTLLRSLRMPHLVGPRCMRMVV